MTTSATAVPGPVTPGPGSASVPAPVPAGPGQVADGYSAALAELEAILQQLERADVDVDTLATQVQRASELIGFCRERITNARLRIDQVVAGLEP